MDDEGSSGFGRHAETKDEQSFPKKWNRLRTDFRFNVRPLQYCCCPGYGEEPFLGVVGAFAAPIVASAINDALAAIWLLIWNFKKGMIKEIGRSLVTIPGLMVAIAAVFGGPIANGAYLVGIDMAGAAAIPISALCPMFGAIFARMFLKQKIDKRVAVGMFICVIGAALISYVKPEGGWIISH